MFVRKLQETKTRIVCPHFLKNMELLLDGGLVLLPGVVGRNEFTSDYSLQLTNAICFYASMEKHVLSCVTRPCNCKLYLCGS